MSFSFRYDALNKYYTTLYPLSITLKQGVQAAMTNILDCSKFFPETILSKIVQFSLKMIDFDPFVLPIKNWWKKYFALCVCVCGVWGGCGECECVAMNATSIMFATSIRVGQQRNTGWPVKWCLTIQGLGFNKSIPEVYRHPVSLFYFSVTRPSISNASHNLTE